jgi:hypothetical protein
MLSIKLGAVAPIGAQEVSQGRKPLENGARIVDKPWKGGTRAAPPFTLQSKLPGVEIRWDGQ